MGERIKYPKNYVAVDLETTGLMPGKDKILEIGAIKVVDGVIEEHFQSFVDPEIPVPSNIQELTGITPEMLDGQPKIQEVMAKFLEFSQEMDLLGHNLIFDYSFLKVQAANEKVGFERNGIDTLKIARSLLPQLESRSLTSLCVHFRIESERAHRAYHDALATHRVYKKLQEIAQNGQEKIFYPQPLSYKVKRQSPITNAQKGYLNDLVKYHKIELDFDIEKLTKSEASRRIDGIISQYGKIMR